MSHATIPLELPDRTRGGYIPKKFYELNDRIKADELLVIDSDGSKTGVISRDEALTLAKKQEMDLVLVSDKGKVPVAKILDFAKFKYENKQKQKTGVKKTKSVEIKEIRFTPFIAQGDFDTRIKKAREFLEDGNKVKLNVKFVGRQITRKEFGESLLERAFDALSDIATLEREPTLQGKILWSQLQPKKN